MFTGIISSTGLLQAIDSRGTDRSLSIVAEGLDGSSIRPGDSISVNGACLTVVSLDSGVLRFDVSAETLTCTTLGNLLVGDRVNLEQALQAGDRLDGHLVSGHVDATGEIVSLQPDGDSMRISLRIPTSLTRYVCRKGSICVDGVSLTVNAINEDLVELNIIPYTMAATIIHQYRPGTRVNVEVDLIARYLERLLPPAG